jgi:hypothetical protein
MLATFEDFPLRDKAASFTVSDAMDKIQSSAAAAGAGK